LLSYLCLLNYGPKLKIKEYVSGRMADILSDLYKSYSVMWLCKHLEGRVEDKTLKLLEDYCLNILHSKIIDNFNMVLNDIKFSTKYLLIGLFRNTKKINSDKNTTEISDLFLSNNELKRILTENVFVPLDPDDIRYKLLNHKNDKNIIEEILKVN
jgi:hypothetical protein